MYCVLCTAGIFLLTLFGIFKLTLFASFAGIYPIPVINIYSAEHHQYDVIIMGAGMAGISAATKLHKNGITNILIIEAEPYVGGRVKTIDMNGGHTVNIGAATVYGACTECATLTQNPILKLLNEYNMQYLIDNTSYDTPEQHMLFSDSAQRTVDTQNRQYLHKKYGNQNVHISDKLGLNGLLLKMASELIENGIDILLNEAIHTVTHDMNRVTIATEKSVYHSKYAIHTFSVGVLQSNLIDFIPSLPTWKYEAIFRHKMVKYTSVYIQWPFEVRFKPEFETQIFRIQSAKYSLSVQNLKRNILKIDIAHNSKSIGKNVSEFVINKIRKYLVTPSKPLKVRVSDWNNNVYFKGVYAILTDDSDLDTNAHWKRMKSRVNNIFFCGEATSMHEFGTVNGAHSEGIQSAENIISCLKSELYGKCPIEYYDRTESDILIEILRQFTDDYRIYFELSVRFVVTRLLVLVSFLILIIRKIVKYLLKDSF